MIARPPQALLQQIRRVVRHMAWLLQDCWQGHRGAVTGIVVNSVGGVLLQGAVLGVLVAYTHLLETDEAFTLGTWTLHARSPTAIAIVGTISLVCFSVSALLIYLSKNRIADVSVRHEQHCSRVVLERMSARPFQIVENHSAKRIVGALLSEQSLNARGCGRAVQTLLSTAYPLIITVYMVAFLAYLNVEVTLLMLFVFLLFAHAYYRLNVSVVHNESRMKFQQDEFRREIRALVSKLLPLNRIHSSVADRIDAAYAQPEVQGMFDRVKQRRVALARADLIGNVSVALALAFALVWLGQLALRGEIAWGLLVVYVIALRVAVGGARSVMVAATTLARWYPYVREFHHLVDRGGKAVVPGDREPIEIPVRNQQACGDLDDVMLRPGDRVGVVSPVELTRFTIFHFLDELLGLAGVQRQRLAQEADFVPARPVAHSGETLRNILHLPAGATWEDLQALVPGFSFIDWLKEWSGGNLDHEVARGVMGGIRRKKIVKLALCATALRKSPLLFVDAGALALLARRAREQWLQMVSDRILVVHYGADCAAVGTYGERAIICGNRSRQCALATADWVRANIAVLGPQVGEGTIQAADGESLERDVDEGEESEAGGV